MPTHNQRSTSSLEAVPTTELMRQVLDETKELVRIETRLARDELQGDLVQLKTAAIFGGAAFVLAMLTLSTLTVGLILALGASAGVAVLIGALLLLAASGMAFVAYQRAPKPPLARTRARIESDVTQLKEHIQ